MGPQAVHPGDQLVLEATVILNKKKIVKIAGKAYVDGDLVCEAEMTAIVIKKDQGK